MIIESDTKINYIKRRLSEKYVSMGICKSLSKILCELWTIKKMVLVIKMILGWTKIWGSITAAVSWEKQILIQLLSSTNKNMLFWENRNTFFYMTVTSSFKTNLKWKSRKGIKGIIGSKWLTMYMSSRSIKMKSPKDTVIGWYRI